MVTNPTLTQRYETLEGNSLVSHFVGLVCFRLHDETSHVLENVEETVRLASCLTLPLGQTSRHPLPKLLSP